MVPAPAAPPLLLVIVTTPPLLVMSPFALMSIAFAAFSTTPRVSVLEVMAALTMISLSAVSVSVAAAPPDLSIAALTVISPA